MSDIYLLNFNNYYNRIVRYRDSLSDYQGYQVKYRGQRTDPNGNTAVLTGVNFFEADSVDTSLVVNWAGDSPDYVLVVEDNQIKSRWFVVEDTKTRGGQTRLMLHRDLIVDYYTELTAQETAIFVEKAIVPSNNNLIFNSEAMTFNQIKTSEVLLKDQSGCPWICVYAAREDGEETLAYNVDLGTDVEIAATLTEAEFQNYLQNPQAKGDAALFTVNIKGRDASTAKFLNYSVTAYGSNDTYVSDTQTPTGVFGDFIRDLSVTQVKNAIAPQIESIASYLYTVIDGYDSAKYETFRSLHNQNIRVNLSNGQTKIYSCNVSLNGLTGSSDAVGALWSNAIRPAIESLYRSNVPTSAFGSGKNYATVSWASNIATISFTDITSTVNTRNVAISAARTHLMDAPYDMFCMPFSDTLKVQSSNITRTASKELALTFANNISKNSKVYDMQLLPYCPIVGSSIVGDTLIMPDAASVSPIMSQQTGQTAEIIGYVLHANKSSFSRSITLENPVIISDYKIESETDVYRLVSPNYNGIFEFSAAKNGGINTINVQCTYKPFNPYIKLYPTWGRLYGSNFGEGDYDARGLICGGDFSLPRVTDAWEEYEMNNKNYQLSFDRQVQNLEVNNSVQREREIWSAVAGTASGAVSGASSGAAAGPVGAVVGGVIGGVASAAGGIRDIQLNEQLRQEAIDYTKDQFGYQLGNIKALPQSLSKVAAYNVDNKYFPFLEYYTCSEVEKQALRDKIKYNGMTVMAIGSLQYYLQNRNSTDPMYFKGKLIRLTNFIGDYHLLNAISAEIYKGAFFE